MSERLSASNLKPQSHMTILGIDTSLRSSGYGVLVTEGSRMRSPEAGRIRNAPKLPLSECLRAIHARVAERGADSRMEP